MTTIKNPRGLAADAGEQKSESNNQYSDSSPRCKLHEAAIVDALPAGCPLCSSSVLQALGALQNQAWQKIGADDPAGLVDLDHYSVCMACSDALRTHPRVRRLRQAQPVEVRRAAPAGDVRRDRPSMPLRRLGGKAVRP